MKRISPDLPLQSAAIPTKIPHLKNRFKNVALLCAIRQYVHIHILIDSLIRKVFGSMITEYATDVEKC